MIYKIETGGTEGWNLELYIPDAAPKDAQLPLLLFNTGNGEIGKNESDRAEIYRQGPMYYIKNGWTPDFMVGGCQSTYGFAGYPFNLAMLQELTGGGYPIDKAGIFLTGLSGGAHACHEYVQDTPADKYIPVRGIIPMSIAPETPKYPERYKEIAMWGFGGDQDSFTAKHKAFIEKYGYDQKYTIYKGGHGGWNALYNPNNTDNNIYDWLLTKVKPITPAPDPEPLPPLPVKNLIASIKVFSDGSIEKV